LADVARRWPFLPEAIRVAILAMVKAVVEVPDPGGLLNPRSQSLQE
jgi:hypothetical protein